MRHFRVWQKLALLGFVFLIPFAVVAYQLISSVNTLGIDFGQKEINGLQLSAPLRGVLQNLQQHGSATAASIRGHANFESLEASTRERAEEYILAVDKASLPLLADFPKMKAWEPLKGEISVALKTTRAGSAEDSEKTHKELVARVTSLISDVSDESNLTLDPDVDSYWLMDMLMFKGTELAQLLGDARRTGLRILASQNPAPANRQQIAEFKTLVDHQMPRLSESIARSFEKRPALRPELEPSVNATAEALKKVSDTLAQLNAEQTTQTTLAAYYEALTSGENSVYELQNKVSPALQDLIEKRLDGFRSDIRETLIKALLGLLAVVLIGWYIIRDITKPLNNVVRVADKFAAGDLAVQVHNTDRRDEIGTLMRSFSRMGGTLQEMATEAGLIAQGNLAVKITPQSEMDVMGNALAKMARNLADLVGNVQRSGIQVTSSVTEIAATSKEQQATANEIAAATTEIGATSNEIFATSKELVKTMKEVGEVAGETSNLALSGQTGLARMTSTMGQIAEASTSVNSKLAALSEKAGAINTVVVTITKVADQTNLLSLNAAIEAEKAGEHGRGFAVVATEIRRLADQTAVATYDIERIVQEMQSALSAGVMGMDKFSEEVRRGVEVVGQVSEQLGQIIQQVQTLIPSFEAVTEGMESQSSGAQQISEALTQLSEGVQQTVETLRQSNLAIEQLNDAVRSLQTGVSRFTLRA